MGECRDLGLMIEYKELLNLGKGTIWAHTECLNHKHYGGAKLPSIELRYLIGAEITILNENYDEEAFCDFCDEPIVPYLELTVICDGAIDEIVTWGQGHEPEADAKYSAVLKELQAQKNLATWEIALEMCYGSMTDRTTCRKASFEETDN